MAQTSPAHAAGCIIYPPAGQEIQLRDAVELLTLSRQLLTLCIRVSAKIDPTADFLVGRAAERVAVLNGRASGRKATSQQRPQAKSVAQHGKLGRATQIA
jgi:hypothetical protein